MIAPMIETPEISRAAAQSDGSAAQFAAAAGAKTTSLFDINPLAPQTWAQMAGGQ
jgi:hypothetical protein